ncbi:MAG: hypothetical protein EHM47_00790 [Ignavibacteriales bacterium]|nr:MAG: hypothetical protein EHM47_00790 [Ignavibacteriales bacterium]
MGFIKNLFEKIKLKRRINYLRKTNKNFSIKDCINSNDNFNKFPVYCEYKGCKNKLNPYSHRCPYCFKYHCIIHIVAEEHKCSKAILPYEMTKGFDIKSNRIMEIQ